MCGNQYFNFVQVGYFAWYDTCTGSGFVLDDGTPLADSPSAESFQPLASETILQTRFRYLLYFLQLSQHPLGTTRLEN